LSVFSPDPAAARPAKKRDDVLKNIRRGDQIVTGGGIVGKVTKVVDDKEVEVENRRGYQGSRCSQRRISEVRVKGETGQGRRRLAS